MKKIIAMLLSFSLLNMSLWADEIKFKHILSTDTHKKRMPVHAPAAFIEDHTLTFDPSCIGCTITLLQDDIIIYSATVEENDNMEGEVVLPDYLTGVFELQLKSNNQIEKRTRSLSEAVEIAKRIDKNP